MPVLSWRFVTSFLFYLLLYYTFYLLLYFILNMLYLYSSVWSFCTKLKYVFNHISIGIWRLYFVYLDFVIFWLPRYCTCEIVLCGDVHSEILMIICCFLKHFCITKHFLFLLLASYLFIIGLLIYYLLIIFYCKIIR